MTATPTDDRAALQQLLGHGPVAYYRAFAAVGGGVTAGVFLSQLFYWHGKGRDPDGWIYKTQAAWEDETGLSRREQETARRNLRQRGIIEEKLAGIPATLHYRINVDRLAALLAERCQALPPAPPERCVHTSSRQPGPSRGPENPDALAAALTQPPDPPAGTGPARTAQSATQQRPDAPHRSAPIRRTGSAKTAHQARRDPPDKPARTGPAGLAQTAQHAETTREHRMENTHREQEAAASRLTRFCSVHREPMSLKHKDGDYWYSHPLPDGTWCRGGPGDQSDPTETRITATCSQCSRVVPLTRFCHTCGRCWQCCQCQKPPKTATSAGRFKGKQNAPSTGRAPRHTGPSAAAIP